MKPPLKTGGSPGRRHRLRDKRWRNEPARSAFLPKRIWAKRREIGVRVEFTGGMRFAREVADRIGLM
jgi:hypothetical protein